MNTCYGKNDTGKTVELVKKVELLSLRVQQIATEAESVYAQLRILEKELEEMLKEEER